MKILGIESSCDECAAAVVERGEKVLSHVVASQISIHARFGGVVPEIASRRHLESIIPVIEQALDEAGTTIRQVDAVAVTNRPGLIGALLIGLSAAKGLALAANKPLIPVHHIEAHIYSSIMNVKEPDFPIIALVVSGGHTSLYHLRSLLDMETVGFTLDDAAGEAFDKVSSILGLGYPGGPAIEKTARGKGKGNIRFPRSFPGKDGFNFSFSGIKTAVLYHCRGNPGRAGFEKSEKTGSKKRFDPENAENVAEVAASFQAAVVDVLVRRTMEAAKKFGAGAVAIGGGVAANSLLREEMAREASSMGVPIFMPPMSLATDNAVMVAGLGYHLFHAGKTGKLDIDAHPR